MAEILGKAAGLFFKKEPERSKMLLLKI